MTRRRCPFHRTQLATLKARLGRQHRGHRIAKRALNAIAKQCPACIQETK